MDEVRKSLTKQEQVVLADLWENKQIIHAFQNALSQRQLHLALNTMAAAPDWENVVENRGKILESKWINTFLEDNFKAVNKSRLTANNNAKSA